MRVCKGTGGSVVEFSPATREARVRFPASARPFYYFFCLHFLDIESLIISLVLETEIELVSAQVLLFNVQSEIARFHMTSVPNC